MLESQTQDQILNSLAEIIQKKMLPDRDGLPKRLDGSAGIGAGIKALLRGSNPVQMKVRLWDEAFPARRTRAVRKGFFPQETQAGIDQTPR
jgi:hypothetical protein